MTQPLSSWVPDFADELYARLTGGMANVVGNLHGRVAVHEVNPQGNMVAPCAFLGDVKDGKHGISKMRAGRKTRDEEFVQRVWFVGGTVGGSVKPARTDCFAMLAVLEDILAEDPSLGLDATVVAEVDKWHTTSSPTPDGWLCFLRVDVIVKTRLA